VPQLRCAISHSMKLRIERTKHRIFVASHSHLLISVPGPRAALDRLAAFLFGTIAGQSADCPVPAHVHGPVTAIFVDEQLPAVYEPDPHTAPLARAVGEVALASASARWRYHSFLPRAMIIFPAKPVVQIVAAPSNLHPSVRVVGEVAVSLSVSHRAHSQGERLVPAKHVAPCARLHSNLLAPARAYYRSALGVAGFQPATHRIGPEVGQVALPKNFAPIARAHPT